MKDLSIQAKLFIIGTIVIGLVLFFTKIPGMEMEHLWGTVLMSVLASLALIFKVEGTTNRSHYSINFVVYSASIFLLGSEEVLLVILISNLVEWAWHKYPWYIQCFNIGSYMITLQITSMVYTWMNPENILFSWIGVISLLVSMGVFTLCNHLLVGIILWLARGENFKQSGMFDPLPLVIDFTLLSTGAGLALVWTIEPLAIIFMIIPLYLIYSTLRVPALERQTEIDPKTGIFNHSYFEKTFEQELSRANRFNRPLTVAMADMDLLRNINNTYGHLAGDEVLLKIAGILKSYSREYDTVARFGGEEFAILLPEISPPEAYPVIERIRTAIEEAEIMVPTSVAPIKVTMSFGIAGRDNDSQTTKDILHNADTAVYHSKLKGRNRTYIYSDKDYYTLFPAHKPTAVEEATSSTMAVDEMPVPAQIPAPSLDSSPKAGTTSVQDEPKKPLNAIHAQPKWKVDIFILLTFAVAVGLLIAYDQPLSPINWLGIGIFMVIVFLTEWFSLDIYARNTAVSVSAAPMLAGFLLFGQFGVLLLSLSFALAAYFRHHSPINRLLFNFSNQVIAGMLCLYFIQLTGITLTEHQHSLHVIISLISSLIIYLSTTILVAYGMSLDLGVLFRPTWREQFSWLATYYMVMGLIAYALVFSFDHAGLLGLLITLVPLLTVRLGQSQYLSRTRVMVQELREKNVILEKSSREISILNDSLLKTLAEVVDLRDPYVLGHSEQVTRYATLLAQHIGLEKDQVENIRKAALLHDIGKLGIPEHILLKPSRLTDDEYRIVKEHVVLGAEILETTPSLNELIPIVRHHHERMDGKGYPDGLSGESIPIGARIVALADAVEAMASDRPYRCALPLDKVIHELQKNSGSQFDPLLVTMFTELAATCGDALIVNSAQKEINHRVRHQNWDIYNNRGQAPSETDPVASTIGNSQRETTAQTPALHFSFVTLPTRD
jgi:diguanylate cyclase (GGDEF)-like protein/putative nucleotidyltransferase with HDIG domain